MSDESMEKGQNINSACPNENPESRKLARTRHFFFGETCWLGVNRFQVWASQK